MKVSYQICRICSSLQKLAWEYFWPHFENHNEWLPFGLGSLLKGPTRITKLKSAENLIIIVPIALGCVTDL